MLNVPYVHVIFTIPHQLNGLFKLNKQLLYSLLYQVSWKTIKHECSKTENVGGLPGMIAVMHSWGSDMKYHVHLHALITFGGLDEESNWHYPTRKDKLAPYRTMNESYRDFFLKAIHSLIRRGKLQVNSMTDALLEETSKINWAIHNTKPQLDTGVLEEYLSRYIMKIAVSNSRLSFDDAKDQVSLIYNDYKAQLEGEPAPKATKVFDPLSFIHQFLQHLPPKSFQRVRYYGLHSGKIYKRVKSSISQSLKREGRTVRTIMQIVRQLLGLEMIVCPECGGFDFDEEKEAPDYNWLANNIRGYQLRAPPNGTRKSSRSIFGSQPRGRSLPNWPTKSRKVII